MDIKVTPEQLEILEKGAKSIAQTVRSMEKYDTHNDLQVVKIQEIK